MTSVHSSDDIMKKESPSLTSIMYYTYILIYYFVGFLSALLKCFHKWLIFSLYSVSFFNCSKSIAVVYPEFRGWGGGQGAVEGGTFLHWRNKKLSVFSYSKGWKSYKNQWKFYKFLKIFKEILRFFEFFSILSKFSRKFMEKFRKFRKFGFVGGSGGWDP